MKIKLCMKEPIYMVDRKEYSNEDEYNAAVEKTVRYINANTKTTSLGSIFMY